MIIFKKQFERANAAGEENTDEELKALLEEAGALVARAEQGVKSDRSPITIVEKIQMSDTTKLVKKLMIDISADIKKGRPVDDKREKLIAASAALRTSIDRIL